MVTVSIIFMITGKSLRVFTHREKQTMQIVKYVKTMNSVALKTFGSLEPLFHCMLFMVLFFKFFGCALELQTKL